MLTIEKKNVLLNVGNISYSGYSASKLSSCHSFITV